MPTSAPDRLSDTYRDWGPRLMAYALLLCGSRSSAEEALQNLFAHLARSPALLAGARDPGAYLFVSLRRHALDLREREQKAWRKVSRNPQDFLRPVPEKGLSEEDCREIEAAVAALPEEHREVVMLRIWAGLGWPEIAEVTGGNVRTLESRYRAALETLRGRLKGSRERI